MLFGSTHSLSIRDLEECVWSGSLGRIVPGGPGQLFPAAKRFFSTVWLERFTCGSAAALCVIPG